MNFVMTDSEARRFNEVLCDPVCPRKKPVHEFKYFKDGKEKALLINMREISLVLTSTVSYNSGVKLYRITQGHSDQNPTAFLVLLSDDQHSTLSNQLSSWESEESPVIQFEATHRKTGDVAVVHLDMRSFLNMRELDGEDAPVGEPISTWVDGD